MKTFKTLLTAAAVTTLAAAGMFAAQTAAEGHGRAMFAHREARMSAALGLSDQQKQQAKAIFQDAHASSKLLHQQLHQQRQAIQAAIQEGKTPADVQAMAQSEGQQLAQLAGIRAAASAKFYAMLTPDQQQKLVAMRQARHPRRHTPAPAAGTEN